MSPGCVCFLIFLEWGLERALLAGWQRGLAVSLPWQPSRVCPSCGWGLAGTGSWRSGNRVRCVRCSSWICGPLCTLHDNCVEWGWWEWETEAAKTAGAQMMYWLSTGERNGDSEHSPSDNSRPGILLSASHVPP